MLLQGLFFAYGLAQILGLGLFILTIIWLVLFAVWNGKSVINELKGDNNKWEIPEVVVIIWLFIFPSMILADMFLSMRASPYAWYSMDAIMFFAIGGKASLAYLNRPSKKITQPTNNDHEKNEAI